MIIKPNPARPGIKLRDPKTLLHVPPEGIRVADDDRYWHRRLMDGDAVAEPDSAPKATKASAHKEG